MAKKKPHGGKREGAGRKASPDGPTVVIGASVPTNLMTRLDAVATVKEWNRSEAITEAIRLLLKRHERRTGVSIPSAEADPSDRV